MPEPKALTIAICVLSGLVVLGYGAVAVWLYRCQKRTDVLHARADALLTAVLTAAYGGPTGRS